MWCPRTEVSEEKKRLLEAGFRQWTKERFMQWRRLSAQHGRHAHDKITARFTGLWRPALK